MHSKWRVACVRIPRFPIGAVWQHAIAGAKRSIPRTAGRPAPDQLSLNIENRRLGVSAQVFVRNATDETVITDQYLTDDTSGLYTNIFLSEPRTYGVSLTKRF